MIRVVYSALSEAEQDVVAEHHLTQEEYWKLLSQHKENKGIREIHEATKKLIAEAAEGKIPDQRLKAAPLMTSGTYVKIFRRLLAIRRQTVYDKMRNKSSAESATHILESEPEKEEIRVRVCSLYGIEATHVPHERYSFVLRRTYYTFMCEKEFENITEAEKAKHAKLMATIMEGWMIPDMEKSVIEVSDEELNKTIEGQLKYIAQFVDPQKSSMPVSKGFLTRE